MKPDKFQIKIETIQQRIAQIQENASEGTLPSGATYPEILEDLKLTLEELQVADEELHQQNDELVQTQQTLTRERQRYQDLFNFAPDAYLVTDPNGTILEVNTTACQLLSLRSESLVQKHLIFLFAQEDHKDFRDRIDDLHRSSQVRNWEIQLHPHVRSPFYASINVAAVHDTQDQIVELRWLIRDVTERKEAQRALKEKTLELERSNSALEQFVYSASHDLQEPLRMVASFVGLLAEQYKDKLDEDANIFIGFAIDGAKRMQNLIHAIRDYSRIHTRAQAFESVNCETILHHVLSNLDAEIKETCALITHDPLPTVMADQIQLEQVFQNLIENALKFHKADIPPQVHISARKDKEQWIFSIQDNGIGIDPQHFGRIFTLFQRLHANRDLYPGGMGIGLTIVKRIIERHGGEIWIESTPGEGTTFYFSIPIKADVS